MSEEIQKEDLGEALRIDTEVCVVGAGFAGLAAAIRLQDKGCKVVVLEARERSGGRVHTDWDTKARWVDLGGQWIGKPQTAIWELVDRSGTGTYETPTKGFARIRGIDKEARIVNSDLDWTGVPGIEMIQAPMKQLEELVEEIPAEAPWKHPDAYRLDRMTFRNWLDTNVPNAHARAFLEADISYTCAAPDEISVLATLATVKQCGGFKKLDEDAQETRIVGGAERIAIDIVDKVLEKNTVIFNQPVRQIQWSESGVVVRSNNYEIHAKRVIVTAPPHVAKDIYFLPELPADRRALMEQWPQGTVIKIGMIFPTPFWRDMGWNGLSLDWKAIAVETADSSPTPNASACGTLTAFVYSTKANEIKGLPPEERKQLILRDMVERFGNQVLYPLEYHETFWANEVYTKGCYGAFLRPGATTTFGPLIRAATGTIHWAGSETSPIWPTFIEGAVRSGYRAADEIVDLLKTAAV